MSVPTFPTQSKKSYLSMGTYNNDFFSYVTRQNGPPKFEIIGSLQPVPGATAQTCPGGRYLYETGRKLYPGGSYPGISTLLVDVVDPVTGLKGFIDPTGYAFTNFSSDRPAYLETGIPADNATNPRVGALNPDKGAPVYTHGDVIADGNAYISGNLDLSGSAMIYGNETLNGNILIKGNETVNGTINCLSNVTVQSTLTVGKQFNLPVNYNVGNADMTSGSVVGGFRRRTVNTTAVTANSRIFLTYTGINNPGILSAESIVAGTSFQIVSNNTSDLGTVNWLIIN
jgi:hypothetical protein